MELRVPQLEGSKGRPRPQLWGGCCRGVFTSCLVTLTLPQLGGAKGFLALNIGGDAVGAFLHSGWWQPQYTQLEGAKGRFHPEIWGGCCRGVFAPWAVTFTVPRLEGAKGSKSGGGAAAAFLQSARKHSCCLSWKGCPRAQIGKGAVGAFLHSGRRHSGRRHSGQLEGTKRRPRAKRREGCYMAFLQSGRRHLRNLSWKARRGASRGLKIGGDVVGSFCYLRDGTRSAPIGRR